MANFVQRGRKGPSSRARLSPRVTPTLTPEAVSGARSLCDQIERAARLQLSLLPDVSLPVGEFRLDSLYWPCETLGGDFYDLTWRQDCAVLLVADVMGHGPEAALITMLVKAAFHETAATTGDPGDLLAGMRVRLTRLMPQQTFVAAAVATLALEGAGIQLANAGLPHPFVLRSSERRLDEVQLDGLPLGLPDCGPPGPSAVNRIVLDRGDVLLIGSDGLGAIESGDGQFFQDRQLRHTLEGSVGCDAGKTLERLIAEAVDFGDGCRFPDDINLVAISRPGVEESTAGVNHHTVGGPMA
jgi:sigma-B regulation protein RsbU (phosphoserine phosphatase)